VITESADGAFYLGACASLFGFPLVLATSLFSAIGGDQLSVMKSQDEILRARKVSDRHSILQQFVRWIRWVEKMMCTKTRASDWDI
jgi:hypothetical protein